MFLKDICNVLYPFVDFNKNIKNINKIVEKISNIKIHNILNLPKEIRMQYKALVYIHNYKKPGEDISIYFFKKKYDTHKFRYDDNKVKFLNCFHLSNKPAPYKYDWKYIEKTDKIISDNDDDFLSNIDIEFNENDLELDR